MTSDEIKSEFANLDARLSKRTRFKADDRDMKEVVRLCVELAERVEKLEKKEQHD